MDKLKKTLDIGIVILAFIAVLLITFSIFYNIFNNKFTISVNNIGDQIAVDIVTDNDEITEETAQREGRLLFEANIYSNENENGKVLEELKFNYFTDHTMTTTTYRSAGMQNYSDKSFGPLKYYYYWANYGVYRLTTNPDYITGKDYSTATKDGVRIYRQNVSDIHNYEDENLYYYTGSVDDNNNTIFYNGRSGGNGSVDTQLTRNNKYIIKLNDKPYALQLNKKHINGSKFSNAEEIYMWTDVFQSVMSAARTNSAGEGSYTLEVDLSQYFSLYEYRNGKFEKDDVSDVIKIMTIIKVNYNKNGATSSDDSIFGSIKGNANHHPNVSDIDYTSAHYIYNYSLKDFNLRYSESADGYYLSFPERERNFLKTQKYSKVYIDIDLSDTDKNILGIDYGGLADLDIYKLRIYNSNSSVAFDFTFLEGALKGSTIEYIQVPTLSHKLIFAIGEEPKYHLAIGGGF